MKTMKIHALVLFVVTCAFAGMAQELRSAGTVLVDLSADAITANDGDTIAQWTNAGTLGGAFAAVTNNAGVSFTNSLLGKKAVLFSGSAQNALTNTVATPSSLTGSSAWTMEAWVWVASIPAAKSVYLSWTEDTNPANIYEGSRLMFRYDAGNVAVDNLGGTVGFSYGSPVAGAWHHIAVVRNVSKQEKVYLDGNAVAFSWCSDPAQSGIPITLGAAKKYAVNVYSNFFSGAVSRVRIHTGMLSDQDVLFNYLSDAPGYNAASTAVWTGGVGNWNDTGNWAGGVAGTSSKAVRLLTGSVSVTNNVSPGILRSLDIAGASVSLTDVNDARIETKTPLVVGRSSGNSGSVTVSRGTLAVNAALGPAVLNLGLDGADSSLAVGGASGAALIYASQIRAFAASSDVQVSSNGVLESDAFVTDAPTNAPSITVSGGTLRSKAGAASMGQFFNVPHVKVSTGGIVFDSVSGSTQTVSAALIHNSAGASKDGGLRKTGNGTLVLSGTNSYTGDTSVEVGTLTLASRLTDGLVYRLDASSNALATLQFADSSNVVTWSDANGSGISFMTNAATMCPVYDATLFGGRGGLRFNRDENISRRMTANRSCRMQSAFFVINPANNNNLGGLWGQAGNDYGVRLQAAAVQFCGNGNDFASSGWAYTNGAPGNAFTVGQPLVVTAISGAPQTWTTAIGSYSQHSRHFRGDLAEVLVYDRRLDDLERQAVEQYLMAKWLGTVAPPPSGTAVLPTNTALTVRSGAAVDLGGTPVQLASLSGSGGLVNRSPTVSTLSVGGLDADSIFSGSITGNVSMTKTGKGQLTLAGPNAFSGATTVESGTLVLVTGSTSVTGLVYRLDASQTNTFTTLADGTNVTVWTDAAGSGYTFTATNDIHCPVFDRRLFNGRGGLRFGVGSRKRMLGAAVTNAQTVFAVAMIRDESNDNGGFWGKNGEDSGLRLGGTTWYFPGNANDFHNGAGGGTVSINGIMSNSVVAVGQPHLVTSVSGSRQSFRPAIGDYWCSDSYPTRFFRGEVAEILVFDRSLTELERQSIEIALMAKWLPAGSGAILPPTAAVSVSSGATLSLAQGSLTITSLSGGGSVSNGTLTVTGNVSPNGTLTFSETPSLTGSLTLDIAADGSCDRLSVSGALNVSGLTLALNLPSTKPSVSSYTLVTATEGVTGPFANMPLTGPWKLVYDANAVRLLYVSGTLLTVE